MRWLDEELMGAAAHPLWQYFLVSTGPLSFHVALMPESPYRKALDAFFDITATTHPEPQCPLLYVYESSALLDRCQDEGSALSECQAKTKLVVSGLLLNWDPVRGLLKYFDTKTNQGIFVARNLAELPSWEWFSPIKEFVHCWALQRGTWLAHAATIGLRDGNALLLVGPGGSGKSTNCAGMILAGYQTCGDDYVLLARETIHVVAHAIYRTIKLVPMPSLIEQNGFLASLKQLPVVETGKLVYFIDSDVAYGTLVKRMKIHSVCGLELVYGQKELMQFGRLGYPHFAMSSLGQIPIWVDRSMEISRMIFQGLSKSFLRVRRDVSGFENAMKFLRSELQ